MTDTPVFTSSKIATEMEKMFGNEVKKIEIDMKFRRQVGNFVLKVDRAHKEAEKSEQIFK